ncbi:hypothetical protein J4Q44_G00223750 [Coregonus suidteri]|uniref:Uncharacterized protein n=1 Tax=Coregonus suidteri TaxID=861788 RepID=A0AAN8LF11_9TELE
MSQRFPFLPRMGRQKHSEHGLNILHTVTGTRQSLEKLIGPILQRARGRRRVGVGRGTAVVTWAGWGWLAAVATATTGSCLLAGWPFLARSLFCSGKELRRELERDCKILGFKSEVLTVAVRWGL